MLLKVNFKQFLTTHDLKMLLNIIFYNTRSMHVAEFLLLYLFFLVVAPSMLKVFDSQSHVHNQTTSLSSWPMADNDTVRKIDGWGIYKPKVKLRNIKIIESHKNTIIYVVWLLAYAHWRRQKKIILLVIWNI